MSEKLEKRINEVKFIAIANQMHKKEGSFDNFVELIQFFAKAEGISPIAMNSALNRLMREYYHIKPSIIEVIITQRSEGISPKESCHTLQISMGTYYNYARKHELLEPKFTPDENEAIAKFINRLSNLIRDPLKEYKVR